MFGSNTQIFEKLVKQIGSKFLTFLEQKLRNLILILLRPDNNKIVHTLWIQHCKSESSQPAKMLQTALKNYVPNKVLACLAAKEPFHHSSPPYSKYLNMVLSAFSFQPHE